MGRHQQLFVFVMLTLAISISIFIPAQLAAGTPSRSTAVAIPDIPSVAGRWSGILYGRPGGTRGQDWVELAIHEDGVYTLASARTIGVFSGSGRLRLADGKLFSEGEKTQVTITLYQRGGKRFLRAETIAASGQPLQADMYPAP